MQRDAEYYVCVYLDGLRNDRDNADLAGLSASVAGLMVDFRGEIPQSSAYKRDTIGWRVDRMRRMHADYAYACLLLETLTRRQAEAVCQYYLLINRHPDDSENRLTTRTAVARYLRVDERSWGDLVAHAIDNLNRAIGFV